MNKKMRNKMKGDLKLFIEYLINGNNKEIIEVDNFDDQRIKWRTFYPLGKRNYQIIINGQRYDYKTVGYFIVPQIIIHALALEAATFEFQVADISVKFGLIKDIYEIISGRNADYELISFIISETKKYKITHDNSMEIISRIGYRPLLMEVELSIIGCNNSNTYCDIFPLEVM